MPAGEADPFFLQPKQTARLPESPSGPMIMRTGTRRPNDASSEMSDVKKMNQPHSLKKVIAQKKSGRPAPIVVIAPPMIETPTPQRASVVFSLRVPFEML